MDAAEIRRLKPELTSYLHEFDDCFARRDTRAHFPTYVEGQLSKLPANSSRTDGVGRRSRARTLQKFLAQHRWDEDLR